MIEEDIVVRDGHVENVEVADYICDRLHSLNSYGLKVRSVRIGHKAFNKLRKEINSLYDEYPGSKMGNDFELSIFGINLVKTDLAYVPIGYLECRDFGEQYFDFKKCPTLLGFINATRA